jgi:glycosyltransferase involved in cell wall biosynthesis
VAGDVPRPTVTPTKPLTPEERANARADFNVSLPGGKSRSFIEEGDFVILNVNKNEFRKDLLRTLEIVAVLRNEKLPVKLVLRTAPTSALGGIHLEKAAEQLGLELDKDWAYIPAVPEEHMRRLYGAADLVLSTSLGEGWGFSITEALGCGTPVLAPGHTSCLDIYNQLEQYGENEPHSHAVNPGGCWYHGMELLALEDGHVCGNDGRLRHRVDLRSSVETISLGYQQNIFFRGLLSPAMRHWLSWDRVAKEMFGLLVQV